MSGWNVPNLIDHTVLRPEATKSDVLRLCQEARTHGFTVIFVPPCYVDEAVEAVAGTAIRVGIPIGFPLGGHSTRAKVAEAVDAVAHGARVLDMVLNVSRLKSGDHDYVRNDIAEVVKATPAVEHKVILETCYLTLEEKRTACHLVVEAGADWQVERR
jgi:deoxyribose-phosphate aldolase